MLAQHYNPNRGALRTIGDLRVRLVVTDLDPGVTFRRNSRPNSPLQSPDGGGVTWSLRLFQTKNELPI